MKYYDQQNLVLHCSSFSKTLGAGFRVGWVYAGKFSEHIQHVQLTSTISVNSFIQNALADDLTHRHHEKHLKLKKYTESIKKPILSISNKSFARRLRGQLLAIWLFSMDYPT